MSKRLTSYRTDPGAGQAIAAQGFDDPIEGLSDLRVEAVGLITSLISTIKIAAAVSGTVQYPDESAANTLPTQSGSPTNTEVVLPTLSAVPVIPGLLIAIVSGTGVGQVRQITGLVSGSKYSVNRAWSAQPASGDGFRLLIDVERFNTLMIKTEYSLNTNSLSMVPILYPIITAAGAMTKIYSNEIIVDNLGVNTEPSETSYYHGVTRSVLCQGAVGAKVLVKSLTGGGTFSLWAAAV